MLSGKHIPISNTRGIRSVHGLQNLSIPMPALSASEAFLILVSELERRYWLHLISTSPVAVCHSNNFKRHNTHTDALKCTPHSCSQRKNPSHTIGRLDKQVWRKCSFTVGAANQHSISILGQRPHYTDKQYQHCWSARFHSLCFRQDNKCQAALLFTRSPKVRFITEV